jgi:hypothetical protein
MEGVTIWSVKSVIPISVGIVWKHLKLQDNVMNIYRQYMEEFMIKMKTMMMEKGITISMMIQASIITKSMTSICIMTQIALIDTIIIKYIKILTRNIIAFVKGC